MFVHLALENNRPRNINAAFRFVLIFLCSENQIKIV